MRRLIAIAITAIVASVPGASLGHDVPHADATESGSLSENEALRRDLRTYADAHGVTLSEAERRFAALDDVRPALRDLEATTRYAGGWVQHEPAFRVIVRFAGAQALDSATQAVLDRPSMGRPMTSAEIDMRRIDVRLNAPHTLGALLAGLERILERIGLDYPDTGAWADVRTGAVVLDGPTPIGSDELAALSSLAEVPIRWEYSPELQLGHLRGGHPISAEGEACTTAFSVRDAITSETGIMTAGHCSFPQLTNGEKGTYREDADTTHSVTLRGRRWDANQDFQWFSSAFAEEPIFWSGVGYRNVTGTQPRLEMPGEYVCHYGIQTGYSCGYVDTVHYAVPNNYCNGQACQAVWGKASGGFRCWPGDSGGPFFLGTVAWGVYSGQSSDGPETGECYHIIFMTIGGLNWDGVNTRVLLAP